VDENNPHPYCFSVNLASEHTPNPNHVPYTLTLASQNNKVGATQIREVS